MNAPRGAVVGREDILAYLATKGDPSESRRTKISHHGTFNANPLSAAAGVAMLAAVADGQAIHRANQQAAPTVCRSDRLRQGVLLAAPCRSARERRDGSLRPASGRAACPTLACPCRESRS